MKNAFLILAVLVFGVSASFATYDYNIFSEYYSGTLDLVDQSVFVSGAGAEKIIANGLSHVEVLDTLPFKYGQSAGIGEIRLNNISTANVIGGEISGLFAYNSTSLKLSGGGIIDSGFYGNSSIDVSGGQVSGLFVHDNAKVYQSDGRTRTLIIYEDATAVYSGGRIKTISSRQNVTDSKHITFICDIDSVDFTGNLLTGNWLDGTSFSVQLYDNSGYDATIDNINFIPEPTSLALLGLSGLLLRRKKS